LTSRRASSGSICAWKIVGGAATLTAAAAVAVAAVAVAATAALAAPAAPLPLSLNQYVHAVGETTARSTWPSSMAVSNVESATVRTTPIASRCRCIFRSSSPHTSEAEAAAPMRRGLARSSSTPPRRSRRSHATSATSAGGGCHSGCGSAGGSVGGGGVAMRARA
jgi:uncharacterized membrane protein YgcG